ncbi:MAG TPA: phospholipase D-like domain-containing protein [Candidatus Binatia bacterium]|nr:phospholipase D-like domain-containing protein [Candidatus Binatia bacterium]
MKDILQPGINCWKIDEVSESGLLIDAKDYYRAFCQAAKTAERYILLAGWQFDSDVALVREGNGAEAGITLISFLDQLCEKNPDLRIYILAWNFSVIYSIDREWLQSWNFKWNTNERIQFCFDSCHPFGASHHQKYVVIDGRIAFLGGLDLCSGRWDDRGHRATNPLRVNSDQSPYAPFHDVQSYHVGAVAARLEEFFKEQWRAVCNHDLDLAAARSHGIRFENSLSVKSDRVGLSRTQVRTTDTGNESVREIRHLFRDAISAAESYIYIENQYFSSQAIHEALVRRMSDPRRSRLEIVLVLAKEANAFVEQASIGIAQAKVIRNLRSLAAETGHKLGIYYPASPAENREDIPTYIHSKLLLVDDQFLSVGSANLNNRSMGLDTELNVSWQVRDGETEAQQSLRDVRVNLLSEHTGLEAREANELARITGLVGYLDQICNNQHSRLRFHPSLQGSAGGESWIETFFPDGLPLDPEGPVFGEDSYEPLPESRDSLFPRGINWLSTLLSRGIE